MDIYENYYIYDDPIPYVTEYSKKFIKATEKEINEMQNNSMFNIENQLELIKLKEEYEKQVLFINPVTMKDYIRFYTCVNCISLEKNKIPDPKIISMSYLDFLFYLIDNNPKGKYYSMMLCDLLNLCCGVENENIKYTRDENNKINLLLEIKQEDGILITHIIDKKDFDNIRNIILKQNMPNYDDTYIDPKVEQALKEADEFINRHKNKMCSLEDQMICVLISTPLNMKEIKNLTIRKFIKILQRVDRKMHYQIYKTASMSGFVSFKEEIDHWMTDVTNEKYSGSIVEYGQFKNNMSNVTKK